MDVNSGFSSNTVIFEQSASVQPQAEAAAQPQRSGQNVQNAVNKQRGGSNRTEQAQYNAGKVNYNQRPDAGERSERSGTEDRVRSQIDALERAIADANKQISGLNREFRYSVHDITKDIMIKIVDRETSEVIKEIPPKKALDAIAKMWELAGIIVDEKR